MKRRTYFLIALLISLPSLACLLTGLSHRELWKRQKYNWKFVSMSPWEAHQFLTPGTEGGPDYDGISGLLEGFSPGESGYSHAKQVPRYHGISGLIERPGAHLGTENYALTTPNQTQSTQDNNISTFAIDVDTASYSNVRRFLKEGDLPPPHAVRVEEMLNYFRYDYPKPEGPDPFSLITELSSCPWDSQKALLLVALNSREIPATERPPLNLVFLVDVSGSMLDYNKLPLFQNALKELQPTLREEDRVCLVTYAGSSAVELDSLPGDHRHQFLQAVDRLQADGSTNGAEGILTAYELARKNFGRNKINRVILATDGDFNVGLQDHNSLLKLIKAEKESGVYLTVLGLGTGNLNDHLMEQLADNGNGNYAYLDSLEEARKVLLDQAGSTFLPMADDVKIQLVFNPNEVATFRQVGYENRQLKSTDFDDDRVDAGDLGAGHQVTALYELELRDRSSRIGELKARYKVPGEWRSRALSQIVYSKRNFSDQLRFAAAVAELGLYLKRSPRASLPRVQSELTGLVTVESSEERRELLELLEGLQGDCSLER